MTRDVQVRRLRTFDAFVEHLDAQGLLDELKPDEAIDPSGPLAAPLTIRDGSAGERTVGNRFAVLPMEGWDGSSSGAPTDLVRRRWARFGASGAKLIWGGEAAAVRPSGRANPRQLVIDEDTSPHVARLREELVAAHADAHGRVDDLLVGLQLTHSGRWSRPDGVPAPLAARRHPELDRRLAGAPTRILDDGELDDLVDAFVDAAVLARRAGFDFVDIKHCHGYLLHELLSATDREGRYGGSFENRTRFLRSVVEGIRSAVPDLAVGVRLSAYDLAPFEPGLDGAGVAVTDPERMAFMFGGSPTGVDIDLAEPHAFLRLCESLGIGIVCVTGGSPYYNPHVQRPAFFPPSDGYSPPRDPLHDVAVMLRVTRLLAEEHPQIAMVGSGYSYLQQWLPHVAQRRVRDGAVASVGIGRGILSYPQMPADVLAGRPLQNQLVCRTFSDCTTAPRNGLVSGCYPLDPEYKNTEQRVELAAVKRRMSRPADR